MTWHPLQSFVRTAKDHLKDMVNVNTTIGEPVTVSDCTNDFCFEPYDTYKK